MPIGFYYYIMENNDNTTEFSYPVFIAKVIALVSIADQHDQAFRDADAQIDSFFGDNGDAQDAEFVLEEVVAPSKSQVHIAML